MAINWQHITNFFDVYIIFCGLRFIGQVTATAQIHFIPFKYVRTTHCFVTINIYQSNVLFSCCVIGTDHGSSTRGPPVCIMKSTATFVNCVRKVKVKHSRYRPGVAQGVPGS